MCLLPPGCRFLAEFLINQVILLFVHRTRPYDAGVSHLLIERSADYSFPSDHATAAFAIAAAFLLHAMPRRGTTYLEMAGLVLVSRVFVGTRYAGDVLSGALTGLFAALAVRLTYRYGTRLDRFATGIL